MNTDAMIANRTMLNMYALAIKNAITIRFKLKADFFMMAMY